MKHVWKRLPGAKQLSDHGYDVTTGDNPRCSCLDFQRSSFPCKHIIKCWLSTDGKLEIPTTVYDPWWTTDDAVIPHSFHAATQETLEPSEPSVELSSSPPESSSLQGKLPISQSSERLEQQNDAISSIHREKVNREIRELLSQIHGFTYDNQDFDTAMNTLNGLKEIKHSYLSTAKTSSKIPLLSPPSTTAITKSRKRKLLSVRPQDSTLKPKRRKPNKYSSRTVGRRIDYVVNDLQSCEPIDHPQAKQTIKPDKSIPITIALLEPSYQLDSDIINIGLQLIHDQWSTVTTQDCLLIQRQRFFDQVVNNNLGDYCQVLHMREAHHWISITDVATKNNQVRCFDSLGLEPTFNIGQAVASKYTNDCRFAIKGNKFSGLLIKCSQLSR